MSKSFEFNHLVESFFLSSDDVNVDLGLLLAKSQSLDDTEFWNGVESFVKKFDSSLHKLKNSDEYKKNILQKLRSKKHLTHLLQTSTSLSEIEFKLLNICVNVVNLSLCYCNLTDDDIKKINWSSMIKLYSLDLCQNYIKQIPDLSSLASNFSILSITPIEIEDLKASFSIPLHELKIYFASRLKSLEGLWTTFPTVSSLNLVGCSEIDLSVLEGHHLSSLDLWRSIITQRSLESISKSRISRLEFIFDPSIDDKYYSKLTNISHINVWIQHDNKTSENIQRLRKLAKDFPLNLNIKTFFHSIKQ